MILQKLEEHQDGDDDAAAAAAAAAAADGDQGKEDNELADILESLLWTHDICLKTIIIKLIQYLWCFI